MGEDNQRSCCVTNVVFVVCVDCAVLVVYKVENMTEKSLFFFSGEVKRDMEYTQRRLSGNRRDKNNVRKIVRMVCESGCRSSGGSVP